MKIICLLFAFTAIIFTGCFSDDDYQPLIPFDGVIGSVTNSIYTYQTYYNLADSSEIKWNQITAWDLGFESSAKGEHIILNSADNLYIANLGPISFSSTEFNDVSWIYDASSGNYDSLAISGWVNTSVWPYEYTQNLYVLAQYDGSVYNPIKKLKIVNLTDTCYQILLGEIDKTTPDTFLIYKDTSLNFVKATLRSTFQLVDIEPASNSWDMLFTPYATIIPDDNGTPTPYLVRGVYINPEKIKVAKYEISTDEVAEISDDEDQEEGYLKDYFESYNFSSINESDYSSNWDIIGYDWKEVTIDMSANTAVYKANTRQIYIIEDVLTGKKYKLRFFSFYTDGVKGFPWFQYIEL